MNAAETKNHRNAFIKLFKSLCSQGYSDWNIWDDLMYFGYAAIHQSFDFKQERETEYLSRIKRYKNPNILADMFAEIVLALEEEGLHDVLGELYMGLQLSNHWKGQFFTPFHVCEMMAKINCGAPTELIKQKGYVSIIDSCCGSGAMLIGGAKHFKDEGIDFQREVLYFAQDLDPVCARMCYIQMSLYGLCGIVKVGDSLLSQYSEIYYTPMYYLNHWRFREREIPESINVVEPAPVADVLLPSPKVNERTGQYSMAF